MRTANPALNSRAFGRVEGMVDSTVMTAQGAVLKTGILTILLGGAAVYTWHLAKVGDNAMPWIWGGMLGGLALALVTIFAPKASPFTSPLYAIAEGLFLGALSALYDKRFPGLPIQAVGLTFCTLFAMLLLYTTGVIRATPAFRRGIMAATFGIMLIYLLTFVVRMFGGELPYIGVNSEGGADWIGIGFNLFVVVIAAMNLVLDFDFIEEGAKRRAPKYMEWYAAFGLLVTLVWLYLELLRLLSRLQRR